MPQDFPAAAVPNSEFNYPAAPLETEPRDPQMTSIQPGGGVCMRIELAWGRLRRAYLKTFRRSYVQRMAARRQGAGNTCPHEVLDPRDVKYYQNQGGYYWRPQDDPFQWRERLPFARVGLGELVMLVAAFGLLTGLAAWIHPWLALLPGLVAAEIIWFFRDPVRTVPSEPGLVIAPADGKVVAIEENDFDAFIGGPSVTIGVFLSIFNVHINRAPVRCRVIGQTYRRGKFLNALRPESARENEQLATRLQETSAPYRRYIVRQITGAIARRIVCWVAPGDELQRGQRYGMIKLGSRTELVMPREQTLRLNVKLGDSIQAGVTILAQFDTESRELTV